MNASALQPAAVPQAPLEPAGAVSQVSQWLTQNVLMASGVQQRVLVSLLLILGLWLARRLLMRLVRRNVHNTKVVYQFGKASGYVASGLGLILIGPIWLEGIGSVGTFLGLLSAGLAIALREPVANLAAWGFILWRRPFEVGDRVEIDGVAGDVVDISLFQFSVLEIGNWVDADQSTGRVVHIPNARLFSAALANSTAEFPYVWNEVPVPITMESNWRAAKEIVSEAIAKVIPASEDEVRQHMKRASEKFLISYKHVTPIVYLKVKDGVLVLTARFLCDPRGRRGTSEGIWTAILDGFDSRSDITLAYPTFRITGTEDGAREWTGGAGEKQGAGQEARERT